MTAPDHPLPAAGGSYIRNPDGSLTLVDPETGLPVVDGPPAAATDPVGVDPVVPEAGVMTTVAEAPAEPAPKPTVKRGVKAPEKEG